MCVAPAPLVLFDLVGTLLDERSDHEALDAIMTLVKGRWPLEDSARDLSGMFALAVMEIIGGEPDVDEPAEFVSFEDAAPDVFAGLMETLGFEITAKDKVWFWDNYLEIQRKVWRLERDALDTVKALRLAGCKIGVVTDADRYLLDDILPRTPLDALIDVRVSAADAGHVKPHAAVFHRAVAQAETDVADAIMVGDSLERDIDGASAAGIQRTVLYDRHDARVHDGPKVRRLRELPAALRSIGWLP